MTQRDALANFFPAYYDRAHLFDADFEDADAIIAHLTAAGYVILPAEEVETIQDSTLEAAARIAADRGLRAKTIDGQRIGSAIAAAIRSLKGAKP